MKAKGMLIWALVFIAVGFIGVCTLLVISGRAPQRSDFSSPGKRIYYTGADAQGRPIPRVVAGSGLMGLGMMNAVACVDCHGEDGQGGSMGMMFGAVEIPDIRYSALTSPRTQDGTTLPAWTDEDIIRSIRDGFEPDGQQIKAPMARWDLTDAEANDVLTYLKALDNR